MPLLKCYGWKRDEYDPRDYPFHSTRADLPARVDLRHLFPEVYKQAPLHSCCGNALAAAIQFEQRKQELPAFRPSRLFIYYNARAREHVQRKDGGAHLRDAIKAVAKHGVPPEEIWPYVPHKFAHKPAAHVYHEASKNRVTEYLRLHHDVRSMKACLAEGYPFVFGVMLYESFDAQKVTDTGIVPVPHPHTERVVGGHAMLCVGYDEAENMFIVRNSWGHSWGKDGYCFVPFEYLRHHKLSDDFWTLRMVTEKQAEAEKERVTEATIKEAKAEQAAAAKTAAAYGGKR